MYCKFCGKSIDDDSIFCPVCGENLKSGRSAAQTDSADTEANLPKKHTVEVYRIPDTLLWQAPPIEIIIDGKRGLSVRSGETVKFTVDEGKHNISFKLSFRGRDFDVDVTKDLHFDIKYSNFTGGINASLK